MKTIRWIVSLVDKKAQALVAILLIGILGLSYTVVNIHKAAEKDRIECAKDKAILNKTIEILQQDKVNAEIEHKKEIVFVINKANDEVKAQLLKSEEKVDKMESIIINTIRAAKNVKSTEKSQERIINHLKINNNE